MKVTYSWHTFSNPYKRTQNMKLNCVSFLVLFHPISVENNCYTKITKWQIDVIPSNTRWGNRIQIIQNEGGNASEYILNAMKVFDGKI